MAELCGSTGTVGQFSQADFAFCHPAIPPRKHEPWLIGCMSISNIKDTSQGSGAVEAI
jgi:hypothetical protein